MKVICIDNYNINPLMHSPVEGEIYTSLGRSAIFANNIYLAELPTDKNGKKCSYVAKQFIPLDGPDERERLKAWKKSAVKADALFEALAEMSPAEPMPQDAFERVWKGIDNKLNRTI